MNFSHPTIPGTVQISRGRLIGAIVGAAALAAATTGVIVAFTVGNGSTASATPALSAEVLANVSNVPLIPKLAVNAVGSRTAPAEALFGSITKDTTFAPTAPPEALFGPIGKSVGSSTAPPEALFGPITKNTTFAPTAPPEALFGPITP